MARRHEDFRSIAERAERIDHYIAAAIGFTETHQIERARFMLQEAGHDIGALLNLPERIGTLESPSEP